MELMNLETSGIILRVILSTSSILFSLNSRTACTGAPKVDPLPLAGNVFPCNLIQNMGSFRHRINLDVDVF